MKFCVNFIEEALKIIPKEEAACAYSLRKDLETILQGVFLELPEDSIHYWRSTRAVLIKHIPAMESKRSKWQNQIVALWIKYTGKEGE